MPDQRELRSTGRVRLHVEATGPADAEVTVVLLHGWTLDGRAWHRQVDAHLRRRSATGSGWSRYDARGHGRSSCMALRTATLAQLGDDLAAVLDAVAPDRAGGSRRALDGRHDDHGVRPPPPRPLRRPYGRAGLRRHHRRGAHAHRYGLSPRIARLIRLAETTGAGVLARCGSWRPPRALLRALHPSIRWMLFGDHCEPADIRLVTSAVARASLRSIGGFRRLDRRPAPVGHPGRVGAPAGGGAGRRPGPVDPTAVCRVDRGGAAGHRADRLPRGRAHADDGASGRGERRPRRGPPPGAGPVPQVRRPAPAAPPALRAAPHPPGRRRAEPPHRCPVPPHPPARRPGASRAGASGRAGPRGGGGRRTGIAPTRWAAARTLIPPGMHPCPASPSHRSRCVDRPDHPGTGDRRRATAPRPGVRPAGRTAARRPPAPSGTATGSPGSAPSARWSSGTRWSSTPPSGGTPWTPSTRGWSSAGWTCATGRCCTSGGSGCVTRTPSRWSSTGGRRPPPPSTGPPRRSRWAWCGAARSSPAARRSPGSRTTCSTRRPPRRACRWSATARCWPTLSRATGRGMRDIVATIQREQDEAIRSPGSGVTIVAGGPGTGKTAVALHRAAYLLYSDRSRFAGGGILVVGPSAVFVEYIASVLPSLGEDTATLHSLGTLVPGHDGHPHGPAGGGGGEGLAADAPGAGAGGPRRGAGRPAASCGCSTGARCCGWSDAELDRIRDRALHRGARRNEVRRAGFDGVFAALWAQARELAVTGLPEQRDLRGRDRRAAGVPGVPQGVVAPAAPPARAAAGWPARTGCAGTRPASSPARRSRLLGRGVPDAGRRAG